MQKEIPVADVTKPAGTAEFISENSETQKYKLSNGATLLYTPNTVNDIIAISIDAKGGQLIEKKAGTSKTYCICNDERYKKLFFTGTFSSSGR